MIFFTKGVKMGGFRKQALVAGLGLVALSAPGLATHSWDGIHWLRTSNSELVVPVGDNVDSRWDKYLLAAVVGWNKSTVIQSPIVPGKSHPAKCRMVPGTIQVCNFAYGPTGWLGLASVNMANGHISAATAKMNDTYATTTDNTPATWHYVMCQEIGHDYGLDHQDEVFTNQNLGTCMDYTNNTKGNDQPNAHDYEMLLTIYNHVESALLVANSVTAAGLDTGNTPKEWGRPIKYDMFGRPTEFVRVISPTEKVLTHVTWATGQGPRGRF